MIQSVHLLAGAAWFGAMIYSLFLLQPRARSYFTDPMRFEEFLAHVSHGARWVVVSAFALIGISGALLAFRHAEASTAWWLMIAAKAVAFVAAFGLFVHISWRFWPARVLALPEEIPVIQRQARWLGWSMLILITLNMMIGVWARSAR